MNDHMNTLFEAHASTIDKNLTALHTTVRSLTSTVDHVIAMQHANSARIDRLMTECQQQPPTNDVKNDNGDDPERIQLAVESIKALIEKLNRLREGEGGENAVERERLAQKEAAAKAKREADAALAEYNHLQEGLEEARLRWVRERDEALEIAKKVGVSL